MKFLISGDEVRSSKYRDQILLRILKDLGAPISGTFRLSVNKAIEVKSNFDEKNNVMVFEFIDHRVKK